MEVKEYLSRYHNMQYKIKKKMEYIDFCEERSKAISSPSYGERIGSNPNRNLSAPFEKWIGRKIDAEHELEEMEAEAQRIKVEIEDKISLLFNVDMERIMVYRYIDWLSWSDIEKIMYFSVSTLKRKHDEAIGILSTLIATS